MIAEHFGWTFDYIATLKMYEYTVVRSVVAEARERSNREWQAIQGDSA